MVGRVQRVMAPLSMIGMIALSGCGPETQKHPTYPIDDHEIMMAAYNGAGVCNYTIGAHSTGPEIMIDARYDRNTKAYIIQNYLYKFALLPEEIGNSSAKDQPVSPAEWRRREANYDTQSKIILGMCGSNSLIILNTDTSK